MKKFIHKKIIENPQWNLFQVAYFLLNQSCESARNRCMAGRKKYINVRCDMTPAQLRTRLMEDEKFWVKWVDLTEKWIESGYLNPNRPTLDRIDDNGHYEIGNIQALSSRDNTAKGASKKCVLLWYNGDFQFEFIYCIGVGKALKSFGLSKKQARERVSSNIFGADYVWFNTKPEILISVDFANRPNLLQRLEEQRQREVLKSAIKVIA